MDLDSIVLVEEPRIRVDRRRLPRDLHDGTTMLGFDGKLPNESTESDGGSNPFTFVHCQLGTPSKPKLQTFHLKETQPSCVPSSSITLEVSERCSFPEWVYRSPPFSHLPLLPTPRPITFITSPPLPPPPPLLAPLGLPKPLTSWRPLLQADYEACLPIYLLEALETEPFIEGSIATHQKGDLDNLETGSPGLPYIRVNPTQHAHIIHSTKNFLSPHWWRGANRLFGQIFGLTNTLGSILRPNKKLSIRSVALYAWFAGLMPTVLATNVSLGPSTTLNPPSTITTSKLTPERSSQTDAIDILIFVVGSVICAVLVVGGRYWRGSWKLPAPTMAISSFAFFILRNDAAVKPEISWVALAIWATATLTYIWVAKHGLSSSQYLSYVVTSTIMTGTVAYIFATVLQEPTTTAIPLFAAFSVFICKAALRMQCTWLDERQDSRQHYSHQVRENAEDNV